MPIPPELVQLLKDHIDAYRIAPNGRLFVGARGGDLPDNVYDRAWKKARTQAFPDDLVTSPLARRPYDLRRAAVSLWLNGGDPPQRLPAASATALRSADRTPTASTARRRSSTSASRPRWHTGGPRPRGGPTTLMPRRLPTKAQVRL